MTDPFDDIEQLRVAPGQFRTITPRKILKRRGHFIKMPFDWVERLSGASGKAYSLALHLLYLGRQTARRSGCPTASLALSFGGTPRGIAQCKEN